MTLEQLEALSAEQKANVVLVVQDPFTSYYDAQVVADFVRLAENWVISRWCCRSRQTARRSTLKAS
jgi:Fe-S oxidoreductase